jgi:hypothetical protein
LESTTFAKAGIEEQPAHSGRGALEGRNNVTVLNAAQPCWLERTVMATGAVLVSAFFTYTLLRVGGLLSLILGVGFHAAFYEGFVRVPANQEAPLQLRGAPGDQIKVRLLQELGDKKGTQLYLRLTDDEGDFQTTLPVTVEPDDDKDNPAVFGRLLVPGVPGRPRSQLTGTIWGDVKLERGGVKSVEVPVEMQVFAPGEGKPSGFRDLRPGHFLVLALVGVGVLGTAVSAALVYGTWLVEWEQSPTAKKGDKK